MLWTIQEFLASKMKTISLIVILASSMIISGCGAIPSDSSHPSIQEPDFVSSTLISDSAAVSQTTRFFYQYDFGSKEGDGAMTPEWALGNLYHGGVKVIEAWYVWSTRPSSQSNFTTGTIYVPFFVVGLDHEDSQMERYRYHKLEKFDPFTASKGFLSRMIHYVSK